MGDFSTQNANILRHMQEYGGISSLEAIDLYGCTRLSARIWDLRHKEGHVIESESRQGRNRYGKMVTYYFYKLKDEEQMEVGK